MAIEALVMATGNSNTLTSAFETMKKSISERALAVVHVGIPQPHVRRPFRLNGSAAANSDAVMLKSPPTMVGRPVEAILCPKHPISFMFAPRSCKPVIM